MYSLQPDAFHLALGRQARRMASRFTMTFNYQERIYRDPRVAGGQAVIKGSARAFPRARARAYRSRSRAEMLLQLDALTRLSHEMS
jgi:hypothetical protein